MAENKNSMGDGWVSLYTGSQTITREEYYRRTENSTRPYNDTGIQRHDIKSKRAPQT